MKRFTILLLTAFFILCSLSIYATPQKKIIRVGLNPWVGTALFYIAKEKKFYEKNNVAVELIPYDEGATGKQLINTGRIDILFTTPETVVVLKDRKLDVQVIAALDSSQGADGIIATKDIKSIEDLKGKTVAFEQGSSSHLLLSEFLAQKNLSTKDIHVVSFSATDAGAAFVAGKVDAAVTWEPWLSKASQRKGGHILVDSSELELFPDFVIVRKDTVDKYPAELRSLLKALFDAEDFLNSNPDEAQKIIAANLKITVDEVKDHLSKLIWLNYHENIQIFRGKPSSAEKVIQQAADFWYNLGLVKRAINAAEIVNPSILMTLNR